MNREKEGATLAGMKDKRKSMGLSAERLAQRCEVSRTTVESIEQGRSIPGVVLAIRIARELGCSVVDIWGE